MNTFRKESFDSVFSLTNEMLENSLYPNPELLLNLTLMENGWTKQEFENELEKRLTKELQSAKCESYK